MKTFRWIVAVLAVMSMGAAHAQGMQAPKASPAQGPWSLEFAYVPLTMSASGGSLDTNAGRFLLGYRVHPNVDIEGMVGVGLEDVPLSGSTGRLTQSLGLFIKPGMDFGNGLRAFARLGSIDSRAESTDSSGIKSSGSKRTTAYGIGLSYRLSDQWAFSLDYMEYGRVDGTTVSGPGLGISYSF